MRSAEGRPTASVTAAADATILGEALATIERGLDAVADIDPAALPEGTVTDAIRRLAALDGRIDGVQARLIAAADAAGVPQRAGAPSTTSWVARTTGRSAGQAARTGRIAKAVGSTPALADGLAAGRVGPDQAATIASGLDRGTLDPEDADDLLANATHLPPGPFVLEARRKEGRRHQARLRRSEQAAHDARALSMHRLDDGSLSFRGQLAPDVGDRFETVVRSFTAPDGAAVPDAQRRTPRQLRADALADALDTALSAGAAGDVGGVRPHVQVHVPMEAMAALADAEDAGVTALTDCDTVLSAAAFAALACDATFRRVVVDPAGMPLDVGRATRTWAPAVRAAIAAADGGCRAPGCDLPASRSIVHHVRFWEQGGATSVANGVLLCNHGHDLVHVEGWTVTLDPTDRVCTWTDPDGTVVTTRPRGATIPSRIDRPARPELPTPSRRPAQADRSPRTGRVRRDGPATRPHDGPRDDRVPRAGPAPGTDPPLLLPLDG